MGRGSSFVKCAGGTKEYRKFGIMVLGNPDNPLILHSGIPEKVYGITDYT
jgi:hypothetical protein